MDGRTLIQQRMNEMNLDAKQHEEEEKETQGKWK